MGAKLITCDLCRFGTRWRKRTGLLICNIDESVRAKLRCTCGGSNGLCGRTGRRHILLKGKAPGSSVNMTSLGQVYPPKFCDTLAEALTYQATSRLLGQNKFGHIARGALPDR